MEPKEKCDEMYMQFRLLQVSNNNVDDEVFNPKSRAKKSALISVDRIIQSHIDWATEQDECVVYWQSVRDELNNL